MTRLTDLPPEILTMIVRNVNDMLYEPSTDLDIFRLMRVNRAFRDIAVLVHLGPGVGEGLTACKNMVKHETCYLNHMMDIRTISRLPCDRAKLRKGSPNLRPCPGLCVRGHQRTLLDIPGQRGIRVFCYGRRRGPRHKPLDTGIS